MTEQVFYEVYFIKLTEDEIIHDLISFNGLSEAPIKSKIDPEDKQYKITIRVEEYKES